MLGIVAQRESVKQEGDYKGDPIMAGIDVGLNKIVRNIAEGVGEDVSEMNSTDYASASFLQHTDNLGRIVFNAAYNYTRSIPKRAPGLLLGIFADWLSPVMYGGIINGVGESGGSIPALGDSGSLLPLGSYPDAAGTLLNSGAYLPLDTGLAGGGYLLPAVSEMMSSGDLPMYMNSGFSGLPLLETGSGLPDTLPFIGQDAAGQNILQELVQQSPSLLKNLGTVKAVNLDGGMLSSIYEAVQNGTMELLNGGGENLPAVSGDINLPMVEAALDNANIREWFEGLPEVPAPKAYEIAVPAAVSNTSGQVVTPLDVLPGSGGQTLVRLSDGAIQNVSDTAFPDPRIQAVYQTAGQFGNTDIANAYVYNYDGYTDPGIYTQEFQSIAQGAQDGLSFEDSVNGLPAAKQGGITEAVQQKIYNDVTGVLKRNGTGQVSIPQNAAQGAAANGTTTVNVPTSHTVSPETGAGSTQNPLETVDGMGDNGYNGGNNAKPEQLHHYATNKSKKYTRQFENILNQYGLSLDEDWNKDLMPHQGRHPNAYHDYILDNMQKINRFAHGDKNIFLKLFDQMKQKIISNPQCPGHTKDKGKDKETVLLTH